MLNARETMGNASEFAEVITVEMDDIMQQDDCNSYVEARDALLQGLSTSGLAYLHFGPRTCSGFQAVSKRAFASARAFFSRSIRDKMRAQYDDPLPCGVTRGYLPSTAEAGGQDRELKEAFSWSADLPEGKIPENPFQYPNIWPSNDNDSTKSSFDALFTFMYESMFAIALALQPLFVEDIDTKLEKHCRDGVSISLARAFHYFGKGSSDFSSSATGSAEHTDWGFATLVLQEVGSVALQAFQNGKWRAVMGKPNTFVLNGSDFLTLLSGGRLKSPLHRVVITDKSRYSFVYFQYPAYETQLPPLKGIDNEILSSISLLRDQRQGNSGCEKTIQSFKQRDGNVQNIRDKPQPKLLKLSGNITFGSLMATKWNHVSRNTSNN